MLKGIEAQLMVTRTAELARDADAILRKNDLVRDYLALQTQALAELEKGQVAHTPKAQSVVFHKDKQGRNRQDLEEQENDDEVLFALEEEDYPMPALDSNTTIDIRV